MKSDGYLDPSHFCTNDNKKYRLILMLCDKLEAAAFSTKQAFKDSDTLMVKTAIENTNSEEATIIVGEDIDLLVVLTQIAPSNRNVYLLKMS